MQLLVAQTDELVRPPSEPPTSALTGAGSWGASAASNATGTASTTAGRNSPAKVPTCARSPIIPATRAAASVSAGEEEGKLDQLLLLARQILRVVRPPSATGRRAAVLLASPPATPRRRIRQACSSPTLTAERRPATSPLRAVAMDGALRRRVPTPSSSAGVLDSGKPSERVGPRAIQDVAASELGPPADPTSELPPLFAPRPEIALSSTGDPGVLEWRSELKDQLVPGAGPKSLRHRGILPRRSVSGYAGGNLNERHQTRTSACHEGATNGAPLAQPRQSSLSFGEEIQDWRHTQPSTAAQRPIAAELQSSLVSGSMAGASEQFFTHAELRPVRRRRPVGLQRLSSERPPSPASKRVSDGAEEVMARPSDTRRTDDRRIPSLCPSEGIARRSGGVQGASANRRLRGAAAYHLLAGFDLGTYESKL